MSGNQTETIKGLFQYTLWEGNGIAIVKYKILDENGYFTAKGLDLPRTKDSKATFTGTWQDFKGRKTFVVEYYETILPSSLKGVTAYLRSLKVGIGVSKARNLYKAFGEGIWDVIENSPDRLVGVKGVTPKNIDRLKAALESTRETRRIAALLKDFPNINMKQIADIVNRFDNAEYVITSSPYSLCTIPGITFERVDAFALSRGFSPDDAERIKYASLNLLNGIGSSGHVCMPLVDFKSQLLSYLNAGIPSLPVTEDVCKASIKANCASGCIKYSGGMVYSCSKYEQECSIAADIKRLMMQCSGNSETVDEYIDEYMKNNSIELADDQKKAIRAVFESPVSIITGGPGTGKTTVTKAIMHVHRRVYGEDSDVVLLAPTGRAARRMSEAASYPATTIHRAVQYSGERDTVADDDYEPLYGNLFIIDETSMMDMYIASVLLRKIPGDAKVVFVGDPDQLPSVGCGNVLHDLIRSEVILTTKLSVIFRQAQDNPIVGNAYKVNHGETNLSWAKTFRFLEADASADIFETAVALYVKCVKAYGLDNVVLLNPYRKKSAISVNGINQTLQDLVNPKKDGALVMVCGASKLEFREGDKVMQTRNTDHAMNGDIGYIRELYWKADEDDATERELHAHIEFNGNGILCDYSEDAMNNVDLAYCSTVHKAQGDEYHTVIMIMANMHRAMLRRNIVYTGITRAKENCAIVGQRSALSEAILNEKTEYRYTLLADRLHSSLPAIKIA